MIQKLYADKYLGPIVSEMRGIDAEMAGLMTAALAYVTSQQLATYIEIVRRFNRDVTIDSDQGEKIVPWYDLREDLKLFPAFFQAAQKQDIQPDQALKVLIATQDAQKYDCFGTTHLVKLLASIFDIGAEKNNYFVSGAAQYSQLLTLVKKDCEIERALAIMTLGLGVGFTVAQSAQTVASVYEHAWQAGYGMMSLYDELKSLETHNVDPTLLYEALQVVIETQERGHFTNYKRLPEFLYHLGTHPDLSQQIVLEKLIETHEALKALPSSGTCLPARAATQNKDILEESIKALGVISPPNAVGFEDAPPEKYFPDIAAKRLLHGVLPYRVQRGFEEGLTDLRQLMLNEFAEGAFVFDRATSTWFSFGGRTKQIEYARFRHTFLSYDASRLSAKPVIVHAHPAQNEIFLLPRRDRCLPEMRQRLAKFYAAAPSGTDFALLATLCEEAHEPFPLEGVIVTSSGLTRFTAPNDLDAVKSFASCFLALKDNLVANFDVGLYARTNKWEESEELFAKRMLSLVDAQLPKGFSVKLFTYDEMPSLLTACQVAEAARPATARKGSTLLCDNGHG